MNILITGANGFIGKFLSEFIKKNISSSVTLIYHKKNSHLFLALVVLTLNMTGSSISFFHNTCTIFVIID